MATLRTPLCDLLGLDVPIIQAPMAGGATTPDLVAAVSAAGALGSFGHTFSTTDAMRADAAVVRARTGRPTRRQRLRRTHEAHQLREADDLWRGGARPVRRDRREPRAGGAGAAQ